MTRDPLKHLIGYGRRDETTGMLHGHIHFPDGSPPAPSGCRWCGQEKRLHGRWWRPGKGYHSYEMPTQAQIKARMRARRRAHIYRPAAVYHATTAWTGEPDGDGEGSEYCADCGQEGCFRYWRFRWRLDARRWELEGGQSRREFKKGGKGRKSKNPWGSGVWSTHMDSDERCLGDGR
ncbi:hypothetical protein [Streptomyces sp. NPDC059076]|uniref:hypothetical protein n=1 Tax=unclassified Streptomyces TaxID=2593676 RepID=UPI0036CE660C